MKFLSVTLALGMVGLLAWAGYENWTDSPDPSPAGLIVDQPVQDLGEIELGIHEVSIPITNQSEEPKRIFGLSEECSLYFCVRSLHPTQIVVPPGETFHYSCELKFPAPGKFEGPIILFLESNGTQEVSVTVRGIAVPPKENTDDDIKLPQP